MKLIVTAGPTREFLDPVRFLSNPSTGRMGFAVAAAGVRRGMEVTLVAGPVALKTPQGVRRIDVVSAREMLAAVRAELAATKEKTVLVATAAVADWRPARMAAQKLKKREMAGVLKLVRNPDILKTVHRSLQGDPARAALVKLVGFAAETRDVLSEAARKCREKGLSFIVANDVSQVGCGFGTSTNRVTFVFPDGSVRPLPLLPKARVAAKIIEECVRQPAAAKTRGK